MRVLLFCFMAISIAAIPWQLSAQTTFKGTISEDTRWSGVIRITGDVIVEKSAVLTIDRGTQIAMDPAKDATNLGKDRRRIEIIVEGQLLVLGGSGRQRVTFHSNANNPRPGDWYGIILKGKGTTSNIKFCIISDGYKGLTCYRNNARISNTILRNNEYAGISTEVKSRPRIINCDLVDNGFAGLVCELGAAPVVESCTISRNKNGIIIFESAKPDLGRRFASPGQSNGKNLIYGNRELNIRNRSNVDIYAQNNNWYTQSFSSIKSNIIDQDDQRGLGAVLIDPLFRQPAPEPQVIADSNPPATNGSDITGSADSPVTDNLTTGVDSLPPAAANALNDSGFEQKPVFSDSNSLVDSRKVVDFNTGEINASSEDQQSDPESLFTNIEIYQAPSKDDTLAPVPAARAPQPIELNAPMLEEDIDGGLRQYEKMVNPLYPEIYLNSGVEGEVEVEATIGLDGSVESYKIKRTDGSYFTGAAEAALQQMRYKPATFRGLPVRFKLIEVFSFQIPDEQP